MDEGIVAASEEPGKAPILVFTPDVARVTPEVLIRRMYGDMSKFEQILVIGKHTGGGVWLASTYNTNVLDLVFAGHIIDNMVQQAINSAPNEKGPTKGA